MCLENYYLHPHCFHQFSLVQRQRARERERETGGWAQFDWMLHGDSFKAQPIEFWNFNS